MEFYTMLTSYVTLFRWKGEGPKGGGASLPREGNAGKVRNLNTSSQNDNVAQALRSSPLEKGRALAEDRSASPEAQLALAKSCQIVRKHQHA